MNEQTVTEAYVVDDGVSLDPNNHTTGVRNYSQLSASFRKCLDIGTLCNNAVVYTGQDDGTGESPGWEAKGQSTDVALLSVVKRLGGSDRREVWKFLTSRSIEPI